MRPSHRTFQMEYNPSPGYAGWTVLHSGEGGPVAGHSIGPAVYNYYLLHTVVSGYGVFETGGSVYRCGAGDTFVIVPGELFRYTADADEPWDYAWVSFTGTADDPTLAALGITAASPVVHGCDAQAIAAICRELIACFRQAGGRARPLVELQSGGLLRLLLHRVGEANRERLSAASTDVPELARQIRQAARWLSLQYNQPVSIAELSRSLGYNRTYLSKMFKQTMGVSPMQYLHRVRMERAAELLLGPLTVAQVASSVGFADALYFSRQFRHWSGLSPSEYRDRDRRAAADNWTSGGAAPSAAGAAPNHS